MDKNIFFETEPAKNNYNGLNIINHIQLTDDNLVNAFLSKNVSLEYLIEKEIYKTNL